MKLSTTKILNHAIDEILLAIAFIMVGIFIGLVIFHLFLEKC